MTSLQTVKLSELCEVWESWHGWYWFITEYHEGTLAFGLVKGWETEWGYIDLAELRQLQRRARVWRVPKRNWALCCRWRKPHPPTAPLVCGDLRPSCQALVFVLWSCLTTREQQFARYRDGAKKLGRPRRFTRHTASR